MSEPVWVQEARKWVGQKEVPGPGVNAWIKSVWLSLNGGGWFWKQYGEDDSRLPWCGAFVAYCLRAAGLPYADKYASASAWANFGMPVSHPRLGAIAVFRRSGGGHVGFVVGTRSNGDLVILGGNQDDGVSVADFKRDSLIALRWPALAIAQEDAPVLLGGGNFSMSQA